MLGNLHMLVCLALILSEGVLYASSSDCRFPSGSSYADSRSVCSAEPVLHLHAKGGKLSNDFCYPLPETGTKTQVQKSGRFRLPASAAHSHMRSAYHVGSASLPSSRSPGDLVSIDLSSLGLRFLFIFPLSGIVPCGGLLSRLAACSTFGPDTPETPVLTRVLGVSSSLFPGCKPLCMATLKTKAGGRFQIFVPP
jgi:hypothetical protein